MNARRQMASRIWSGVRRTVLGLLVPILLSIGGGLLYRAYRHHLLDRATVIHSVRGIDETFFTRIGGIDQWIAIRGQDRDNPVLCTAVRASR